MCELCEGSVEEDLVAQPNYEKACQSIHGPCLCTKLGAAYSLEDFTRCTGLYSTAVFHGELYSARANVCDGPKKRFKLSYDIVPYPQVFRAWHSTMFSKALYLDYRLIWFDPHLDNLFATDSVAA